MAFSWGSAVGKVFDWIPGRKESLLNKINKLEAERNALQDKPGIPSVRDHEHMQHLLSEIKRLREKLKTNGS